MSSAKKRILFWKDFGKKGLTAGKKRIRINTNKSDIRANPLKSGDAKPGV